MKHIYTFFTIFFLIILLSACISAGSLIPALGFALSYACYKTVFSNGSNSEEVYDPIDSINI